VDFPELPLQQTENLAAELSTNRSGLIRLAVERFIAEHQQRKMEEVLAAGYVLNAEVNREVAGEFAHADSELL
jgi:hypothetical protein